MSYAEHGPRIFLAGGSSGSVPLTYGDYVLPRKRLEGRLKLYDSCSDIRAWSLNPLERSRYFRELNEHAPAPRKVIPFNIVMENMITLTSQAQNKLRNAQRELQKYKSLKLTVEQQKYLQNFDRSTIETKEIEEVKMEPIIRPVFQETLFTLNKLASLQHSDTYLSIYFNPNKRSYYDKNSQNLLLANTHVLKKHLNTNPLFENNSYLVSHVTSQNMLNEVKATRECSNQVNTCIEYVDAFSQVVRDLCEVGVQTDEYKNNDNYNKRSITDASSNQYYESTESTSTSESELALNSDSEMCERSHKRVIIQKDSEIIVLKNELGMKDYELEELRELNKHSQTLLEEKDKNTNILKRNLSALQGKLNMINDEHNNEIEDLNAKLAASQYLVHELKKELSKKYQICHFQSQEIYKLREQIKGTELLSMENESLAKKVKNLSKEAESYSIALEQMKNVWRERDMLQKQYREQSCTLADSEDEIKRLLVLIKQMSVTANTREVEMNDVVIDLRNEIQAKNDKIAQCEMQLVCMEQEIGNLNDTLKNSLNNLDESKIAYEGICEYTKCEHDSCLDIQSALSNIKAFITELEECKLERRNRLREINNLKACMAHYSQESISDITNTDFDSEYEVNRPAADSGKITEYNSTSNNCNECYSSKEDNIKIQSHKIETTTTSSQESERMEMNGIISYEEIDRALAMHIKYSIEKIYEISTILQGAGDQRVQISKECAKQQQELEKKNLEIAELKQQMAKHVLRRGEGDGIIQEQLRKKISEKERELEATINKRDSDVKNLHQHLYVLENEISNYRTERDSLKLQNVDLDKAKNVLSEENYAKNEELKIQKDQMCKLIQQVDNLKQTISTLKEETVNIEDMRKKLIDLQTNNNDLTNKLIQANDTISKNIEIIADLTCKDEKNKMALTHTSFEYDAMITQKHSDIMKLKDENQLLRDQLKDTEIKLARSNKTISLLKTEGDSMAAISALQVSLSGLDKDKEKLLVKISNLKTEIAACREFIANTESELQTLTHENDTLKDNIETVRNTNKFLLQYEDTTKQSLKDALYTLPGKIYDRIMHFLRETKEHDDDTKIASELCQDKKIISSGNREAEQPAKIYADKSCQLDKEFYTNQSMRDKLDLAAQDINCDSTENHKLGFLETQYETKLQEIESLMNDVKLRDHKITNLQECITYLLKEKNSLQNKIERQVEEYQKKLTLLKKKYDSSLNSFRKRHNENVERLQARFEDIMKLERGPFDPETWLQSLNLKELAKLYNRINILSSRATDNDKSDIIHIEGEDHYSCRNNAAERKFFNKFTLHEESTRQNVFLSNIKENKEKSFCKSFNIESNEKVAITELHACDSRYKSMQKHRLLDNVEERSRNSSKPKIHRAVDWQREKFIYQCSIHHKLNNAR